MSMDFQEAIRSGDRRQSLTALRDLLAESLSDLHDSIKSNSGLCRRCGGSLSEAGLASLAQRLTHTMGLLDDMEDPEAPETPLDKLRSSLYEHSDGAPGTDDNARADLGTKRAKRRKGSSRTGRRSGLET